jgi:hypothetical protein
VAEAGALVALAGLGRERQLGDGVGQAHSLAGGFSGGGDGESQERGGEGPAGNLDDHGWVISVTRGLVTDQRALITRAWGKSYKP